MPSGSRPASRRTAHVGDRCVRSSSPACRRRGAKRGTVRERVSRPPTRRRSPRATRSSTSGSLRRCRRRRSARPAAARRRRNARRSAPAALPARRSARDVGPAADARELRPARAERAALSRRPRARTRRLWIQDLEVHACRRPDARPETRRPAIRAGVLRGAGTDTPRATASTGSCSPPVSTGARPWSLRASAATCCRPACRSASATWKTVLVAPAPIAARLVWPVRGALRSGPEAVDARSRGRALARESTTRSTR